MNKKKIIKKEERESIRIRQYATLKKNLFILGAVILAIGYIFFISFDFDKNKGEKKEPEKCICGNTGISPCPEGAAGG